MEELGSIWHQESMDEMNLKLQYATLELESVKIKANEQIIKHKEDIKQLLNLLQIAYHERDEARDQLQMLLHKLMPSSLECLPQLGSPLLVPAKANSSITESNSLSENYYHSHNSSPVDHSFLDAATSPEFSSINQTKNDPGIAVIDAIAKGKMLPENGKFLQSVIEAGPLLQTHLVAGPLPRWRNPPLLQPYKIPPVFLNGCDAAANANPAPNPLMSRSHPNLCSTSVLNFSSSAPTLGAKLTAGATMNTQFKTLKRQRIL